MGIEIERPVRKLIQKGKYCAIYWKYKNVMGRTCMASSGCLIKEVMTWTFAGRSPRERPRRGWIYSIRDIEWFSQYVVGNTKTNNRRYLKFSSNVYFIMFHLWNQNILTLFELFIGKINFFFKLLSIKVAGRYLIHTAVVAVMIRV